MSKMGNVMYHSGIVMKGITEELVDMNWIDESVDELEDKQGCGLVEGAK